MRRREILISLGAIATDVVPRVALAQRARKRPLIGILWHEDTLAKEEELGFRPALLEELAKLGYRAGTTADFEERFPGDVGQRYDRFAIELVDLKPDVILAISIGSALALKRATSTIPVVFVAVPDPLGGNLIVSLPHPGTNFTGVSGLAFDTAGKRMQLFHEITPSRTRVAMIYDRLVKYDVDREIAESTAAAERLNINFQALEVREIDQLDRIFADFARAGVQGVIVGASPVMFNNRKRIAELANSLGIATLANNAELAISGLMVSYGVSLMAQFRAAPAFVDKILKGEKPQELPVQLPTVFELTINLKTAKQVGVDIPEAILARADRVIE